MLLFLFNMKYEIYLKQNNILSFEKIRQNDDLQSTYFDFKSHIYR